MKMLFSVLSLLALPLAVADLAVAPGAKAAVTQDMLSRVNVIAVPMIVSYLSSLPIPDQDLGGGLKIKDISLQVLNEPGSSLTLKQPNSVGVAVTDFKISARVKVEWLFVTCKATAHTQGADLSLTIGAVANDSGSLTFSVDGVSVNLGDFGIDMDNLACDVVNDIVGWFMNEQAKVESSIKTALESAAGQLNDLIGQWSYQVPTADMGLQPPIDQATLDMHFEKVVVPADGTFIVAGVTGEVRDVATPSEKTPVPVAPLPDFTAAQLAGHGVTAEISNYTIDSAFYTYFKQGALSYFVDAQTLDDDTRTTLATDSPVWGVLEYEWDKVFDGPKNVSLLLEASSQPQVTILKDGISLGTDFDFTFIADNSSEGEAVNPVTLVVFTCPLVTAADLKVNATKGPIAIVPYVHNDTTCVMSNKSSPIQPIGPSPLQFLNEILLPQWLPGLVDQLNGLIGGGIEIPVFEAETPSGLLQVHVENASLSLGAGGIASAGVDISGEILSASQGRRSQGPSQLSRLAADFKRTILHQRTDAVVEMEAVSLLI